MYDIGTFHVQMGPVLLRHTKDVKWLFLLDTFAQGDDCTKAEFTKLLTCILLSFRLQNFSNEILLQLREEPESLEITKKILYNGVMLF